MFPKIILQEEIPRHSVIAKEPCIVRPVDWLNPCKYVAVKIVDEYFPGRILEVSGKNPPILKICMFQGRKSACDGRIESCLRGCPKRLLTTADNGAVLTAEDIIFGVLEGNPYYGFIDPSKTEELFDLMTKLEKRQKSC